MQNTVTTKVAVRIANLAPDVENKVVDVLVQRELDRRSTALVTIIDRLDKAERDFRRLGADVITFDENGAKTSEAFSKARVDERKKAKEQIDKMTKAIDKALTGGDFNDLYNLANQKAGGAEGQ